MEFSSEGRASVGIRLVLGTAPNHVSIAPNQNGAIAKYWQINEAEKCIRENTAF